MTVALSALIFAVALQAAGVLIWGAALTQRVKQTEKDVTPVSGFGRQLARIEAQIEILLERMPDPPSPPARGAHRPLRAVGDD